MSEGPDLEIVVVEYAGFHCPFCRRHAVEVLPRVKREFIDTGHVRYVYRHAASVGETAADVAPRGHLRRPPGQVLGNPRAILRRSAAGGAARGRPNTP